MTQKYELDNQLPTLNRLNADAILCLHRLDSRTDGEATEQRDYHLDELKRNSEKIIELVASYRKLEGQNSHSNVKRC